MVHEEGFDDTTKPALKSTTIQGAILTIIGAVGSYLEAAGKLPIGGAGPILALAGGIFSFIGRIRAKGRIGGLF